MPWIEKTKLPPPSFLAQLPSTDPISPLDHPRHRHHHFLRRLHQTLRASLAVTIPCVVRPILPDPDKTPKSLKESSYLFGRITIALEVHVENPNEIPRTQKEIGEFAKGQRQLRATSSVAGGRAGLQSDVGLRSRPSDPPTAFRDRGIPKISCTPCSAGTAAR
jgi:hypothetical protein